FVLSPSNTLKSSPNPSTYGQSVTFTATVTSIFGPPPDGETVSFMKGKTVLGTGTLSAGTATFTTSKLKVGTTSVTAVYAGDASYAGSTSNTIEQVVEKVGD
ncbi:MAG: Ig-like domain-containing protein, partial [Terriglobales bacterium]